LRVLLRATPAATQDLGLHTISSEGQASNFIPNKSDAPDALSNKLYLISDAEAEKFGNLKYYDCRDPKKAPQTECRERKDRTTSIGKIILRFEMNLYIQFCSLRSNSNPYFRASTEVFR
jgi:hypothetical protein